MNVISGTFQRLCNNVSYKTVKSQFYLLHIPMITIFVFRAKLKCPI